MTDFVRKAGWTKHALLSQFIGRMFLYESCSPLECVEPKRNAHCSCRSCCLVLREL